MTCELTNYLTDERPDGLQCCMLIGRDAAGQMSFMNDMMLEQPTNQSRAQPTHFMTALPPLIADFEVGPSKVCDGQGLCFEAQEALTLCNYTLTQMCECILWGMNRV